MIKLIERSGLMEDLQCSVIEEITKFSADWKLWGYESTLAVYHHDWVVGKHRPILHMILEKNENCIHIDMYMDCNSLSLGLMLTKNSKIHVSCIPTEETDMKVYNYLSNDLRNRFKNLDALNVVH